MASWWTNNPLPPGWESKWDPGQNRYFFIDHTTKKTSWIDPRSPEGRHLVAAARPQQPTNGNQYNMQAMGTVPCARCNTNKVSASPPGQVCASCTVKAAQIRCNVCDKNVVKNRGDACTQCMLRGLLNQQTMTPETSFGGEARAAEPTHDVVRADERLVTKLKADYPKALESHVRAALESTDNVESKARTNLEKRGYKTALEVKTDELVKKLRPKYTDCGVDVLKTTIISCDGKEDQTVRKLKELGFLTYSEKQEKKRQEEKAKEKRAEVERKMKSEFPSLPESVMSMALEAASYDEKTSRAIIKTMASDREKRESTKGPASKSAGSQPVAARPASSRPSTSGLQATTSRTTSPAASPAKQATPHAAPRPTLNKSAPRQRVTTTTKSKAAVSKPMLSKVSKLAHGADSSLPKGAQHSLLLRGYNVVKGPDNSLVNGPRCAVIGTQGASGPDRSLVKGPINRQAISV